jgi:UDP:flavonoid glycosyltransferase YjiC (YdhE family)
MAAIVVVTWAGGGNLPPMLAVAGLLAGRGHEVRVLATRRLREEIENAGLEADVYSNSSGPPPAVVFEESFEALTSEAAGTALAGEVRDKVRGADLAVIDCMLPAGIAGARAARVPTCSLVHFHYGLARPELLRGSGWTTNLRALEATHRELEIAPPASAIEAWEAVEIVLVAAPVWFDAPRDYPANVVHAGPLGVRRVAAGTAEPQGALIAFSTTAMDGQLETVQRALEAIGAAGLPAVFTTGPALSAGTIDVPETVTVHRHADHDALMSSCEVVVTHGGLGTTLRALAHGVPLVILPLGRDQTYNAERVTALGAGVHLSPTADPARIRGAIERVIGDTAFRAEARRLAQRIARERPDEVAAAALEACVAGRKIHHR